ncbi:MAG: hypothetical protein DWQ07_22450 [Chloroflexi bacterium]|nr:MAG: hypothetical protein DWQ07_22450 [Chloroflexota bacterium]MBL1193910.1 hypothetical protein [Chloroflexota bacterium]NOH11204.1 hypothetical protein [Chloroflexota bacterium]
MNLLFSGMRQRIGGVFAAFAFSAGCCVCGAVMTFVLAPNQALEARRISRLPEMDAVYLTSVAAGEEVLLTGTLQGNELLYSDLPYVAFKEETWIVSEPTGDAESNSGRWDSDTVVPDLDLNVGGQIVVILSATDPRLSGDLLEETILGEGPLEATYSGESLPDGTLRYEGFVDGDVATVLGEKATDGGVRPEHLFAGDRAAFETSQEEAASGLFISGIASMVLAPFVLIAGILGTIFWRRR